MRKGGRWAKTEGSSRPRKLQIQERKEGRKEALDHRWWEKGRRKKEEEGALIKWTVGWLLGWWDQLRGRTGGGKRSLPCWECQTQKEGAIGMIRGSNTRRRRDSGEGQAAAVICFNNIY